MNQKILENVTVVGIGASAGGLEAIQAIVSHLPPQLPGATIVIAQHLSPDYKSMLVELLSRKTSITVNHIENGMSVKPNTIYIAPPSDDVTIQNGTFQLKKPNGIGAHPSVDILLTSLAKQYGVRACGVILSGTGKDGSKGIVAIKKAGGTTVTQTVSSSKYDGMPQAALDTGFIDLELSPQEIGAQLPRLTTLAKDDSEVIHDHANSQSESFPQILELLEQRIGVDFSDYKTSTMIRRINKRMAEHRLDSEQQYLQFIRKNPEELDRLFEVLLIGVTSFFRDPAAFESIEKILSKIIEKKSGTEPLRVWIPGCATGEEAYTIAIVISECLEKQKRNIALQLFATDIDMRALQKARVGLYSAQALKNVPPQLLEKHFKKITKSTYEVSKDIRKLVLFSRHDVTSNPPFLRLDLISCRNLLIYFNNELQKKVIPIFYYALNPEAYLLLGKSENIGKFQTHFSALDGHNKIFQRRNSDDKLLKFPHFRLTKTKKISRDNSMATMPDMTISDMAKETLFNSYEYPFVVVDDKMDIIEISGDISMFLAFREGSATLNLSKLVVPSLQIELRSVVSKAISTGNTVTGNIRRVGDEKKSQHVKINVRPLMHTKPNDSYFMVIFERLNLDNIFHKSKTLTEEVDGTRIIELEHELDAIKEHMNSLVEELETSNEELQATNEELQASNEELQASNEELETSNEELQATNEELQNAYGELREASNQIEQQKKEILKSADDLSTLLNNTMVGFIMIDKNYKVMSVNKTARRLYKELFNSNVSEGTAFIKVLPDSLFPSFHKNFKRALAGKQVVTEEEIAEMGNAKRYFDFNYTPVDMKNKTKTKEANYIIVSFVEVTNRKHAEINLTKAIADLEQEKKFMQTLTESSPIFVWTADAKGSYIHCNKHFLNYTGKTFKDLKGFGWSLLVHPDDLQTTDKLWDVALKSGHSFSIEHRLRHHSGDYRWHLTLAEPVHDKKGLPTMWVGSSIEIESVKLKHELEEDMERLTRQRNELIQLNKVKDEFIGLASHQLRTPATAVKQYIGLVMEEYAGPVSPDQLQYLQTAYTSNERQLRVINDLLKTAQLDASGYTIHKKKHNILELIQEVVNEMQPALDLKTHNINVISKNKQPLVSIDYAEMKLVFTNLVENASKYSYPNTEIKIKVSVKKHAVEVAIKDQGVGIDTRNKQRIFEKFTRVDNDLSDTVSGSGLGLYWVKRIVKVHGGDVEVVSKLKEGTTFIVRLPI